MTCFSRRANPTIWKAWADLDDAAKSQIDDKAESLIALALEQAEESRSVTAINLQEVIIELEDAKSTIADLVNALEETKERITNLPAENATQHDAFVSIQMRIATVLSAIKGER